MISDTWLSSALNGGLVMINTHCFDVIGESQLADAKKLITDAGVVIAWVNAYQVHIAALRQ